MLNGTRCRSKFCYLSGPDGGKEGRGGGEGRKKGERGTRGGEGGGTEEAMEERRVQYVKY